MAKIDRDNEKAILEELNRVMDDFINRVFEISQENLIRDKKVDTGFLLKSGNINRKFVDKEIVYSANYADHIENGRNAGTMPPVDPLEKWARRKLGVPKNEARNVAWAIATQIKKRGILPSPYLFPAVVQAAGEQGIKVD